MPWLPDRLSLRRRFLPPVLRGMRFLERVVIGVWSAFTLAAVSVFASTIPYIYAAEDNIRCGAFALTTISLTLIRLGIFIIVCLAIFFAISRFMIKTSGVRFLGVLLLLGSIFWSSATITGIFEFFNYIYIFDQSIIGDAPKLPDNKNDQIACRNLILQSRPHDLIRDYLVPLTEAPNQLPIVKTPPGNR